MAAASTSSEPAGDLNPPHVERVHREALRRQHVAHLRGADAERHCTERAVRRSVAVAARDRHARLSETQLRPDHVDDALVLAADVVEGNPVLGAVALER